ncbi:rCG20302 [Rattus norvegicus]|uniref:RCG20302 n=1 Tax=Rattus norvegicus TaxID=10116 RepID=A6JG70_RAT|nr:rCG20302 [Rattus norvegicus]
MIPVDMQHGQKHFTKPHPYMKS